VGGFLSPTLLKFQIQQEIKKDPIIFLYRLSKWKNQRVGDKKTQTKTPKKKPQYKGNNKGNLGSPLKIEKHIIIINNK
tara:strand:- start:276 stop:509 length:234 start_codon:yes stop_codon:yes gene_type:complete